MPTELDDIRAAFEHQIAQYGPFLYGSVPQGPMVHGPNADTGNLDQSKVDQGNLDQGSAAQGKATAAPQPSSQNRYDRIAALVPSDSPLNGMNSLEEVSNYVANSPLIDLDKTRLNPVFGIGNSKADLLVLGGAPRADDDKNGEPFVGAAGQLLTQILDAIDFKRTDVYITHVLKSRPPGDRDPLPEEVNAHIPILQKQIALIQPKIILCVGIISGSFLLGFESTIEDMRGTFHDYYGIPVLVTYHPEELLQNASRKRPTWEDVQLLRAKYNELTA